MTVTDEKVRYKFKTRPYNHQVKALKRLMAQEYGGALLMSPRTGKTKTTIDYMCAMAMKGKIDRAIVVAPNRVLGTWVQEFAIHAPLNVRVSVWDAEARKNGAPPAVTGYYDLEVLVVNYDAFAAPGKKTKSGRPSKASGRFKNRTLLRKWMNGKPTLGVLDESHKIKSPSGRASNMLVTMHSDFKYRLILTGTPVTKGKRIFDVYMQWKFLNPERFADLGNLADFKHHFGRWEQVETMVGGELKAFPKFKGARNLKDLHKRMAKDAIIVRREDCFDLPPREDLVHFVDLKASNKAYQEMAEELITQLENGEVAEASIQLVKGLRLSQITSGFVTDVNGEVQRIGFEKADALKEILSDLYEKGEHVVVAARWVPDLDAIEAMGEEVGFKTYSVRGGIKRTESDQNILNFRKAEEPSLMIIQPSAASLGIDLSTASTMVWFSHTPSWTDFIQASDRIALSRNSTTFIHLVARNTVDEGMLQTLTHDGEVAKAIMDNPRAMLTGHSLKTDRSGRLIK